MLHSQVNGPVPLRVWSGARFLVLVLAVAGGAVAGCGPDSAPSGSGAASGGGGPQEPPFEPIGNASAALSKRMVELWLADLRSQQPGTGDAELRKQARDAVVKEVAARQAIHEGFLVLSPPQEESLAAGQSLAQAKARSKLLIDVLQDFDQKVASPPGLDVNLATTTDSNVDAEILAHYLELSLLELTASLGGNQTLDEKSKVRYREVVRILRDEDLASIGSLKEVEALAKRNLEQAESPAAK